MNYQSSSLTYTVLRNITPFLLKTKPNTLHVCKPARPISLTKLSKVPGLSLGSIWALNIGNENASWLRARGWLEPRHLIAPDVPINRCRHFQTHRQPYQRQQPH